MEEAPSLAKTTSLTSFIVAVSRVTGYLKVAVLAYALGATRLADSYNLANVMPNMIYELIAGGILSVAFIPLIVDYLAQKKDQEKWQMINNVTNVLLAFLFLITLIGIIFPYPFVRVQTLTVKAETITLALFFFRFFIPQIIFYGLCTVFTGVLNAHKRFYAVVASPIVNNFVTIFTVLFLFLPFINSNRQLALTLLAIGTTLGVASMAFAQFIAVLGLNYRWQWQFNLNDPALKKILAMGLPLIIYTLSNQIMVTVNNNLAFPFTGGLTAFQYARAFFYLPYGVLAVPVIMVLFPQFCESVSKENLESLRKQIAQGLRLIMFVILPASAFILIYSQQIIRVALEHGAFNPLATKQTAPILACFALDLLFFTTFAFFARVFYAFKDTATPTKVNLFGVSLNALLNIGLVKAVGLPGLALGEALTYLVITSALVYLLRKKILFFGGRKLLETSLRILIATIGMSALMVFFNFYYWTSGQTVKLLTDLSGLLLAFFLGFVFYLFLSWQLKIKEAALVADLLRKGLRFMG